MIRRQAALTSLSQKGGNSVTQTELNVWSAYIIIKWKPLENETLYNNYHKLPNESHALERLVMNYFWLNNSFTGSKSSRSAFIMVKTYIYFVAVEVFSNKKYIWIVRTFLLIRHIVLVSSIAGYSWLLI